MVETPNPATINMYPQSDSETHFRLNKINKINDYLMAKILKRETLSKTLSKYVAAFDYFDKTLLLLPATSGGVPIASFVTCYWCINWNNKHKS